MQVKNPSWFVLGIMSFMRQLILFSEVDRL